MTPEEPEPGSAHRRIRLQLERRITSGEWPVGTRLRAEPLLAQELGVSRGTLRRALAALREEGLVEAAPGRGSRVVSSAPARDRVRRIGVVVPSIARPSGASLVQAIEDELHRHGYSMLFGTSGTSRSQEAGRIRRLLENGVAGIIAYPIDYEPDVSLYSELVVQRLPLVFIDRYLPGVRGDAVVADNAGGAYQAVKHLADLGHRRIGFLATDNVTTTSVAERLHGYRQALAAADLAYDDELVWCRLPIAAATWGQSERQQAETARLLAEFLARAEPTAVFALHNRLAFYLQQAAEGQGSHIPDDLSIVAFGDDPLAQTLLPGLGVVQAPRELMGRLAARVLVQKIQGSPENPVRYCLATSFEKRESTMPPTPRRVGALR